MALAETKRSLLDATHDKQSQLKESIAKSEQQLKDLRVALNELKGENLRKPDRDALYKVMKKKNHMEIELEEYHMSTVLYKVFILIIVRCLEMHRLCW